MAADIPPRFVPPEMRSCVTVRTIDWIGLRGAVTVLMVVILVVFLLGRVSEPVINTFRPPVGPRIKDMVRVAPPLMPPCMKLVDPPLDLRIIILRTVFVGPCFITILFMVRVVILCPFGPMRTTTFSRPLFTELDASPLLLFAEKKPVIAGPVEGTFFKVNALASPVESVGAPFVAPFVENDEMKLDWNPLAARGGVLSPTSAVLTVFVTRVVFVEKLPPSSEVTVFVLDTPFTAETSRFLI